MTTNILLQSYDVSSGLSKTLGVAAGLELNDGGAQGAFQIEPVSTLGALQALAVGGFASVDGAGAAYSRVLTSGGTIDITNADGVAGNPILDVVDGTSIQKVNVYNAGSLVAAERGLNFIAGSGISYTIADSSVNNRVDVTIAASEVEMQKHFSQSFAAGYPTTISPNAKAAFALSTPSNTLLNLLKTGGAGTFVVSFNMALNLVATGTAPISLNVGLYTDATLAPTGFSDAVITSPVSTIVGSTGVIINKDIADFFNASATKLVIWIENPDATNSVSVSNLCNNVSVMYLSAGFN